MRGHVWLLVLPLAALAACSGEDRPAAGGGSSSGVSGGGGSGGPTGNSARATIDVTGTTLAMTASRGSTAALPADTTSASTYTVEGTALRTTSVCPGAGAQRTIAFSAVGGGLAIFTDASHREVYSRK